MPFTLWIDDQCLGSIKPMRHFLMPRDLIADFAPDPSHLPRLRDLAIGIPCISAWMMRDVRLDDGTVATHPMLQGSRLFALIAERVEEQSRRLPLHLRDDHLREVPTALIVVQATAHDDDEWLDLYTEASEHWQSTHPSTDEESWETTLEDDMLESEGEAWQSTTDEDDAKVERQIREYLEKHPRPPFQVHIRLINATDVRDEALARDLDDDEADGGAAAYA